MDWQEIGRFIPTDHARQVTSRYYIDLLMRDTSPPGRVLDLGCGTGASLAEFRAYDPGIQWIGVDIGSSQEAASRPQLDAPVVIFDGVRLPFADASFPLVYSHQVFEHVRHPRASLAEVARVLRPGAWFAGSTSQLEPYHSRSLWNYTIPGFCSLIADAGLEVIELRPGIDGVSLIERAFHGNPEGSARWFTEESPLNQKIDAWAAETRRGAGAVNHRKLRFCGQFSFLARR